MRTRIDPRSPSDQRSARGPQSVGRVISILEFLIGNPKGASLSQLALHVGAPITSLVGLCNALVDEQCLQRAPSGRYLIGKRVHVLASRAVAGRELVDVARPFLLDLVRATDETAVLGVLAPDVDLVVYLDKVESSNAIRYAVGVGERRELHCTAIGKVFLAYFPPERLAEYLAKCPFTRFTPNTITDPKTLAAELERVRKDGIAFNIGERVADASGIAVPVFGPDGSLAAGLLLAGPAQRIKSKQGRIRRLAAKAAAALTETLGGQHRQIGATRGRRVAARSHPG